MVGSIAVKEFAALDESERKRLFELTKDGPSTFRDWLNDVDKNLKRVATVSLDDKIVGWAAACPSVAAMQIGVYVDVEYRQRGFGKKVLIELMDHLTARGNGRYIQYESGFRNFFQPILDKYGYGFHSEQQDVMFAEHNRYIF